MYFPEERTQSSESHWSLWPQKKVHEHNANIPLSPPPSYLMARVHYYFTDLEFPADSSKPTCCLEARDIWLPSLQTLPPAQSSLWGSPSATPSHQASPTQFPWYSRVTDFSPWQMAQLATGLGTRPLCWTWCGQMYSWGVSVISFPVTMFPGLCRTGIKMKHITLMIKTASLPARYSKAGWVLRHP